MADLSVTKSASPVVRGSEKNGSVGFCVYNRPLNTVTERGSYTNSLMNECIESLGKAKMFTELAASFGYSKFEIGDRDMYKTAFATHYRAPKFFAT